MHDGHEGNLTGEEDKGDIAEENEQEQVHKKGRENALLILDIVEDAWLDVLLAEVAD